MGELLIFYSNFKMQLQTERTCDQSKQSSQEGIENLKKKITFTNSQLHQIISNPESFTQRIKELNRMAVKQINDEAFQQSLIYLSEAEKNLQYAASCGISLDRVLITTTLKNQACAYQRLWELATCYDYMQALIFNLSIYTDNSKNLLITDQIRDTNSPESKRVNKILNQKLMIAMCYLHFSALSSQLGKHEEAKRSVQKSLDQFKILCSYCEVYQKKSKGKISRLLGEIRENIQFNPNTKAWTLIKSCKKAIQKVKNYHYFFNFDSSQIEKLRMGDIMQINCSTIEDAHQSAETDWFISQLGLTYMSIYISCCFFALATEIRLGIPKNNFNDDITKQQIAKAKIYHLHAIQIASETAQIQSSFLNHIVKSFQTNFLIDLLNYQEQEQQQFEQISEISIKEKKPSVSIKGSQESRQMETVIFKGDDEGTKIQNGDSQVNSHVEESNKKEGQHKKQAKNKLMASQSLHQALAKIPKFPKKLQIKQKPAQETSKSRGSKQVKNSGSKSHTKGLKSSRKQLKLNTQYFWKKEENPGKNKMDQNAISPRSKISRKPESSQSRPKMKIKSIKSPSKP